MIPWGRRKTDHFVFKTTAPAGNIAGGAFLSVVIGVILKGRS